MLAQERENSNINVDVLQLFIHGSQEFLEKFKKLQDIIASDPITRNDPAQLGLSRKDKIEIYNKKAIRFHQLLDFNQDLTQFMAVVYFPEQLPSLLHQVMFIPTILNLGTEKQIDQWLPLCRSHQISGCYAQTELAHGSDVQSLQTTATFDKSTDEFIINTPNIEAAKWWVGDLGFCANYAAVFAKLIIDGKSYGIQTFLVPIRDLNTHQVLPGIEVGDIGPKYGFNTKDNGYAVFKNIRIPRDNMLMRFSKVNKSGEFVKSANEKIGYATMMKVRSNIINHMAAALSKAVIIATRYSVRRTQFKDENKVERKILNYQTQQNKLFPLISEFYVQFIVGRKIREMTTENITRVQQKNDFSMMNELHALLCGCKAVNSYNTLYGVDVCRTACGGHGYSSYSGIPSIITEIAASATYEGDYTVLMLQTARFIVKNAQKIIKNQSVGENEEYLKLLKVQDYQPLQFQNLSEILNLETVRKALMYSSLLQIKYVLTKMANLNFSKDQISQKLSVDLVDCAKKHIQLYQYKTFVEHIFKINDEPTRDAVIDLALLYGINILLQDPTSLFGSKLITGTQISLLRRAYEHILDRIRPNAIKLVDVFIDIKRGVAINDNCLNSAIGDSQKENIYETLFEWSKNKNELNEPEFHQAIFNEIKGWRQAAAQAKL